MTFTDHGMRQARYTTRANTLDIISDACKDVCSNVTVMLNGPADGLSLAEAARMHAELSRIVRAAERAAQAAEHTRLHDVA